MSILRELGEGKYNRYEGLSAEEIEACRMADEVRRDIRRERGETVLEGTVAIVLAAGKGSRMNSEIPKQFMEIDGYPVLYYSLKAFEASSVDSVVLVASSDMTDYCRENIVDKYGFSKVKSIVSGGSERCWSVYAGLEAASGADYVLIHDGARPCITPQMINDLEECVREYGACTAGVPAKDTIKLVDANGQSIETPDREHLWQIQTPQGFDAYLIWECYQRFLHDKGAKVTDDTMLVENYSEVRSKVIMGSYENIKITTPEDIKIAQIFLKKVVDTKTRKC